MMALVIAAMTTALCLSASADSAGNPSKFSIPFRIDFKAGEGSGTMDSWTVYEGQPETLPECTFKQPDYKVFDGWTISGDEGIHQAGEQIIINRKWATDGVITVTATWQYGEWAKVTTKPLGYELTYTGYYQQLCTAGWATGGTMQYALSDDDQTEPDPSDWRNTIPELKDADHTYVWYRAKGDAQHGNSYAGCTEAVINKTPLTITAVNRTIAYGMWPDNNGVTYDGFVNYETEVTAGLVGDLDYDYSYKKGDPVGQYTIMPKGLDAGNYKITFAPGILTVNPMGIEFSNVTLDKTQLTYTGQEQTVNVVSVTGDGYSLTPADYDVTGNKATEKGTYTLTITGKGNYNNSVTAQWAIVDNPMTVLADHVTVMYDGKPHGISVSVRDPANGFVVKYGKTADACTLDASPTITDVSESPLKVYYRVTAEGKDPFTGFAKVTIKKADVTISKAPAAVKNLVADGTKHELLKAGSVSGGELQYAKGENQNTAPKTGWSTQIPKEKDAGTWYVWYRVAGDGNHTDAEPVCVTVKISKRPAPGGKMNPVLKSAGKTSLKLSWTKMKNVDGYDVFMAGCTGQKFRQVKSVSASKDFCRVDNLEKGACYKMFIRAYVLDGKGKKNYVAKTRTVHSYTNSGNGEETNPKDIRLNTREITVAAGEKANISATLIGEIPGLPVLDHMDALRFESSDEKIAKVSEDGKVTGRQEGTCKIRVNACNGLFKTVTVTVTSKLTGISFPKKEYRLKAGETLDLATKLKREPAGAVGTFTWKSSKEKVAAVSKEGIVTALKKGTATITVTTKSGLKAKVKITVNGN